MGLEEVFRLVASNVHPAAVSVVGASDAASHRVVTPRDCKQVDVIEDEAVTEQVNVVCRAVFRQEFEVDLSVGVGEEGGGALASASRDVMGYANRDDTSDSRHAAREVGAVRGLVLSENGKPGDCSAFRISRISVPSDDTIRNILSRAKD